jgi:hypothetical protein
MARRLAFIGTTARVMVADTVARYIQGLLNGETFKRN